MDFIEVTSQMAPSFHDQNLIYVHCIDLGAQESVQLEQLPCLTINLVLGHVSFPGKIAERRMCGFLSQQKAINLLKDRPSPVLVKVINSCDIKVGFLMKNLLIFLAFAVIVSASEALNLCIFINSRSKIFISSHVCTCF